MNSKNINRSIWAALTLSLCLGVMGYSPFSAQATDPQKAPAEDLSVKPCECQWTIGTHSTGWLTLGQVGGAFANKKKLCNELAQKNCNRAEVVNLVKNNVPATQACPGGVDVYFDTQVEGKKGSRDGYCRVVPGCVCTGWHYK